MQDGAKSVGIVGLALTTGGSSAAPSHPALGHVMYRSNA